MSEKQTRGRRWPWLIAAVALLACLAITPGCRMLRAKAILEDALEAPSDLRTRVAETNVVVSAAGQRVSVHVVRPVDADGPLPAVIVCHGAAAGGAFDARLVSLARAIAAEGATVASPDLPSLRAFHMDSDDPRRLADVALWLSENEDWTADGRVSFLGICVGGSYSLLAAADERLAGRVGAVLSFGAYSDLDDLLHRWMTEPAEHPDLFDPLTEGRRLVLLGNVGAVADEPGRAHAESVLRALVAGRPPPADPASLGPGSRRVVDAARSEEPLSPAEADALLAPLEDALRELSPGTAVPRANGPIYLLHATDDPVVPVQSAAELAGALSDAGHAVETHVTGLFSHVDAERSPSFGEAWSLLWFFASFLDDAGM